ncbi:MAG TPA: DUF559 domain-containing protein [Actinomycetota bacterium]|nr:DUF559 domain-containing protein [Actinomycetota bacterium]
MTTPARTLLDLGAVEPVDKVEAALDGALRTGLVSLPRLRWFVSAYGGRGTRGTGTIKRLFAARPTGYVPPHSPLEAKVWKLIVDAGLPLPVRQHEVRVGRQFIARVDLAYPDLRVAVEADGYRWHSGRREWSRDLTRRNRLTALGWRVLHVTHEDVQERPGEIARDLERLLGSLSLQPRSAKAEAQRTTAAP